MLDLEVSHLGEDEVVGLLVTITYLRRQVWTPEVAAEAEAGEEEEFREVEAALCRCSRPRLPRKEVG